jgi:hypothetical protein
MGNQVLYAYMENYAYGDCRTHMGIAVCIRAGIAKIFAYRDPCSHNQIVRILGATYISQPRSLLRCREFETRAELLIMACPKRCRVYIWDLKKRWRVLNSGMLYQDIGVCEKIFVACCCPHNFLLEVMERNNVRIGRGGPLGDDCMWLDGHTTLPDKRESDQMDALQFG